MGLDEASAALRQVAKARLGRHLGVLLCGALTAGQLTARTPRLAGDALANQIAGWPGVNYRGQVSAPELGETGLDAVVNRGGDAHGTMIRGAGHAEFLLLGGQQYLKADRAWWQDSNPDVADRFTGVWLQGPGGQFGIVLDLLSRPESVAATLRSAGPWRLERADSAEQEFGAPAGHRVALAPAPSTRLVRFEPLGRSATLQVTAPEAAKVAGIDSLSAAVAGAPRYWDEMSKEPGLTIKNEFPDGPCASATCQILATVGNTGSLNTSGNLQIWMDSTLVRTIPVTLSPGSVQSFTAAAANPYFSGHSGQHGAMNWLVRYLPNLPRE